ncbi:hypothetical protein BJX76DRAFT_362770 [Aspergillus varians]
MSATVAPESCPAYTGSPDTPWDNCCSVPLYQPQNSTYDRLAALRGCCPSPDQDIGFYGADRCEAYCNVTADTYDDVLKCLENEGGLGKLREYGCSAGGAGGVGYDREIMETGIVYGSIRKGQGFAG